MSRMKARWTWTGDVIAAHVEMLRGVGLIDDDAAETLLAAIGRVAEQTPAAEFDLIGLVREFDGRIETQAPPAIASVALAARGVIDVAATVARLELRAELLALDTEAHFIDYGPLLGPRAETLGELVPCGLELDDRLLELLGAPPELRLHRCREGSRCRTLRSAVIEGDPNSVSARRRSS